MTLPAGSLGRVADLEENDRSRRSLERRLSRSRLGRFNPIADFDWNWPTRIDRDRVEAALRLEFLAETRNAERRARRAAGPREDNDCVFRTDLSTRSGET